MIAYTEYEFSDGTLSQTVTDTTSTSFNVLSQGVTFSSSKCSATVSDPDLVAAQSVIEQEVSGNMEDIFNEMRVGIHFSDKIEMSCASPSN